MLRSVRTLRSLSLTLLLVAGGLACATVHAESIDYFKAQLESAVGANTVREVRGRGLMLAIELHPEAGAARRYCEGLQARGILAKDTHDHTIRIAPPLVITPEQVDWALEQIAATVVQDFS